MKENPNLACLFRSYRSRANARGHEFELSYEELKELIFSDCYLCGSPPSNTYVHDKPTRYSVPVIYSGIDRDDNSKGYVKDNVYPACWKCNRSKADLSLVDFLDHIQKIYNNLLKQAVKEESEREEDENAST